MADSATVGVISVAMGAVASIAVAFVSRPKSVPPKADVPESTEPPKELTTISGLASAIVQQGQQLAEVQERLTTTDRTVHALRRYLLKLQHAWPAGPNPMPDPDPEDEPLIRG